MKNKLAAKLFGEDYESRYPFIDFKTQVTGKTTSEILAIISEALKNPNKPVYFKIKDSIIKSRLLADEILFTIHKLDLNFLKVKLSDCSLTYELFED